MTPGLTPPPTPPIPGLDDAAGSGAGVAAGPGAASAGQAPPIPGLDTAPNAPGSMGSQVAGGGLIVPGAALAAQPGGGNAPSPIPSATGVAPAVKARFASPLKLDDAQERNWVGECIQRINELRMEMGLSPTNEVVAGSWMWLRQCHESFYQGDLTWRLAFGGIFLKSNITLGSGLRHVRYNSARVQDDLLGTSPFMAALALKTRDEKLAKQVEDYIQGEIENSNVRESLREAQKVALYRNESVVKTGYISDTSPFIGEATVLIDTATGEPITTKDKGLFIYEDDDFIANPQVEGLMMLEADPSFMMAQNAEPGMVTIPADEDTPERTGTYQHFDELPQKLTRREGVYADPLDYRSFLCPLKVKSVHEADTVVHLYLETPNRLQKVYGGIDCSQKYFSYWNNPGQDKPKFEQGEKDQPPTSIFQQIVVAEVYRHCDPDGTGEDKECFLVLDLTNQKAIYYNYLANHMGKRPFESVPGIEKVPGRWYGRGIYGMLDSHLFYEDVEASRSFFKNSTDATIQLAYKDAVEEWRNGQNPEIGTGETFWVNANWDMEGKRKVIWRENMNENFAPDVQLMNIMRQSADSLVGAISTASANQSNFDQSKTATGNQLVQQASDVITKATEQDQTEALQKILEQVVETILERMDTKVLRADPATGLLATINRNEARNMPKKVRLLLTRSRSTQLLNTSTQALDIVDKQLAFMAQDLKSAKLRRPLVISQLKGLEVQDADELVPEISDEDVQAFEAQKAQAAQQGASKPPSEAISYNLKDMVGNERNQVLAKIGIQADEQAAQDEHAHKQEVELAKAKQPEPKPGGKTPPIPGLD